MNNGLLILCDFFLPRICPGCSKKLSADEKPVCAECMNSIFIPEQSLLKNEFERKFAQTKILSDFHSAFIFEADKTLQNIIHALKYDRKFRIGTFLGKILAQGIEKRNWSVDIIIPVPIHHLKKAERGYNQSDFIAKGISKSLNIPCSVNLVKRTRYTDSQTGLNATQRVKNVENAFKVRKPEKIKNKNLLVVDDVITTGATTLECAKVLITSGAEKVYACSVGIAE